MKAIAGKDYVIIDTPARPDSDELKELAEGCDLLILGVKVAKLTPTAI
jgi:chromosome partitioning protein